MTRQTGTLVAAGPAALSRRASTSDNYVARRLVPSAKEFIAPNKRSDGMKPGPALHRPLTSSRTSSRGYRAAAFVGLTGCVMLSACATGPTPSAPAGAPAPPSIVRIGGSTPPPAPCTDKTAAWTAHDVERRIRSHTVSFATVTLTYVNHTTAACAIPIDLRLRAIEPSNRDLYAARPWNPATWMRRRDATEVVTPGRAIHVGFIWTAERWRTRCIGPTQLRGVSVAFGRSTPPVEVLFSAPQSICRLNATYATSATAGPVPFAR